MISEETAKSLVVEIATFEEAWKVEKLRVRANMKKGVAVEFSDDLRIARGVWYKEAKRRLRHAAKVVMYKAHILELFTEWKVKSDTLAQIQKYSDVKDLISDKNLQPFLEALHELEAEGTIKVEREAGTANEAAKDTLTEAFSPLYTETKIQRTIFTTATPSHGFAGAVCSGCIVHLNTRPTNDLVREMSHLNVLK